MKGTGLGSQGPVRKTETIPENAPVENKDGTVRMQSLGDDCTPSERPSHPPEAWDVKVKETRKKEGRQVGPE